MSAAQVTNALPRAPKPAGASDTGRAGKKPQALPPRQILVPGAAGKRVLVNWTRPYLYPMQERALFTGKIHSFIEASTKAGKTVGSIVWLMEGAILDGFPGWVGWWIAPSINQAKIAYFRFKRYIAHMPESFVRWNDSDRTATFWHGGQVFFRTGDNPDLLYGEDVYRLVVDEASRVSVEAWEAVLSTTTSTASRGYGHILCIGNVTDTENWFYKACRAAENGEDPDAAYAKITADDAVKAGMLAREVIERARKRYVHDVFRALYYCEPVNSSNPFGLENIVACTGPLSPKKPVVYGVDLGSSSSFLTVVGLDDECRVCYFDSWKIGDWGYNKQRIMATVGKTPTLVDATGLGRPVVQDMIAKGVDNIEGFEYTQESRQLLLNDLALTFQERGIVVPDGPLVKEAKAFKIEFLPQSRRWRFTKTGKHDDAVMGLALAVRMLRSIRLAPPVEDFEVWGESFG